MDPVVAPAPVAPAAPPLVGIVDSQGNVSMVQQDQLANIGEGFAIATPAQIALSEAQKAQGGPLGALKAAGEAAASTATFGASTWLEKELGIRDPVDIEAGEETHPISGFVGSGIGALGPLGAEKLLEEMGLHTAARVAGGAPGLIADAGEAATGVARAATSKLGRIGSEIIAQGAGSAIEGAAYGLGQSVSEDALDPDLTVESAFSRGVSDALLGGAFGGGIGAGVGALHVPLGLVSSALKEEVSGAKLADKLKSFAAEHDLKSIGAKNADFAKIEGTPAGRGKIIAIAKEANEAGYLPRFSSAEKAFDLSSAGLSDTGEAMETFVNQADANTVGKPDLMGNAQKVLDAASEGPLKELSDHLVRQKAAKEFRTYVDFLQKKMDSTFEAKRQEARFAGLKDDYSNQFKGKVPIKDLWTLRQQISEGIYDFSGSGRPGNTAIKEALQKWRGIVSDEINASIERAGQDSGEWKRLNRLYQVGSTIQEISGKALKHNRGLNGLSLTETGALLAGAPHGPLGLLSAAAFVGAKRYGDELLATGARHLRRMLPEAVEAGPGAPPITHAKQAVAKAASVGAVPNAGGINVPGKVEALAALERIQRDALQDINGAAKDLVGGTSSAKAAKAPETKDILDTIGRVNQLAGMPDQTAQLVSRLGEETHEHAPGMTSKAGEVAGRMIAYLSGEAPQSTKPFPMSPKVPPDRAALLKFHEKVEAVKNPVEALRRAPSKTVISAIQAVYPSLLAQVRSALISEMAEMKADKVYTHHQKMAMSNILGVDLDGSQDPRLTALVQASFLANSHQPGHGPGRPHISLKTKSFSERLNPAGGSSLRNP